MGTHGSHGSAPSPRTPRQEAMVRLLAAAGHVQQRLEAVCGAHELTHDQYNVLRILRGVHPGGHPRFAIAERLLSRAPDVTRLLGRLVRVGLVERYRSEEDQRLSIARITDRGLDVLHTLDPEIRAVHEELATDLDAADAKSLADLCGRIVERAGA